MAVLNPASLAHDDVDSDLPRHVQTRIITMADHCGLSGYTAQDHPLHFDPSDDGVAV